MTVLAPDALLGKVVLVSGGTQGLGAAVARTAARCGADAVVVTGRNPDKAAGLLEELDALGAESMAVRADVGQVPDALNSVAATVEAFGRVDCVVNAAAVTTRGTLVDTSPALFDEHMATNARGPFFIMQAAVKDMLSRGAPGSIVNIISISSHGGQPFIAAYVTAKAGLAALTKNAAHAHRSDRIRINGLNIGWTATPGEDAIQRTFHGAGDDWLAHAGESQPFGRLGDPDEIADMVVFLLSDGSGIATGSVIDWDQIVMGGFD
jgi:NAD(P)-dependent dehydrogenase (short-subunit alcohol dehydrogenase family)